MLNILGLQLRNLETHRDNRGELTEIFRNSWVGDVPVQWNLVQSAPGVLRGVHGHFRHSDYLLVLGGVASIGLNDVRPGSKTQGRSDLILMEGERPQVLTIPPGVAHGFYFHSTCTTIYSVTHYWDTDDELGCMWNDSALGLAWPCEAPLISERDARLPSYAVFCEQMKRKLTEPVNSPAGQISQLRDALGNKSPFPGAAAGGRTALQMLNEHTQLAP